MTERQNADDKRIQQLLAVIAVKDKALKLMHEAFDDGDYKDGTESYAIQKCEDSLATKPEDVELVEVGEADFDKPAGTVNLDIYNIDFDGLHNLYTIKTKE